MSRRPAVSARDPQLRRHLLVTGAVALAWRVVAWVLLARTPFFTTPVVDASHFDLWARALAEGREFQPGAFFKPPFYPYLLSGLYKLGFGITGVYALQALAGAGTALLVVLIARRVLPARGALAAGLATALLPILPFFELQLLAESWTTLLTVAAVLWLLQAGERPTVAARAAVLAGVALGLAALGRPNLLPVVGGAAAWLALVLRRERRPLVLPVVLLLAGAGLAILPATLHNARASGAFVPVSANLGANLVTGNRDRADGVSAIPVGVEWDDLQLQSFQAGHREPASSSRWLAAQARAWIAAHPGRAAGLLGRRVLALLSGWEPRNNIGAAWLARQHGVVILQRWWPGTWLLLACALPGLVAVRWNRAAVLLAVVIGLQAVSVMPFFVNARFRMPLLPLLAVFAVAGAMALAALRKPTGRTLAVAAVFVAALVVVNVDWLGLGAPRWGAEDAFNEALIALRGYGGRPIDQRAALNLLAEASRLDPSFPDAPERTGSLLLQEAQGRLVEARRLLAKQDHAAAQAQAQATVQLLDAAAAAHRQALAAYPRSFNSLSNLGAASLLKAELMGELAGAAAAAGDAAAAGRLRADEIAACDAATGWFDRALALSPEDRTTLRNRALAAERRKAADGAAKG